MVRGSCSSTLRRLLAFVVLLVLAGWSLVSYGAYCIQRGAHWIGVSLEGGLVLVFACDPQSGIRTARFDIWPWKKVDFEKTTTRHRRPLRAPVSWCPSASWQQRVGSFRILYRVDGGTVDVLRLRFK